jgi:hypothetical protein
MRERKRAALLNTSPPHCEGCQSGGFAALEAFVATITATEVVNPKTKEQPQGEAV